MLNACLLAAAVSTARADYQSTVLADSPKAYYRFNDNTNRTLLNYNSGSLGDAGDATNDLAGTSLGSKPPGAVHPFPGAIAGDSDRSEFFDFTTRTEIPFNPAVNPPNTQPFTMEAWIFPASDEVSTGQGVLCNRYTQGADPSINLLGRQGWVMYQRAPDTNHCTSCGPGVGWEFRMYNGQDGSGHIDVTSGVPFTVGQWQHVVVVYDPVDSTLTNATASIYIDGVLAAVNTNNLTIPGYVPCTGDHDPSIAVNGQPALSLGGYNNANGGTYGFENPWFGAIDEFAFYAAKLTPAQILAHYQNGTNANRAQPYPALIQAAHPVVYLRLDEVAPNVDVANNLGSSEQQNATIGTHTAGVVHPATGPLVGRSTSGATSYHQRNGNTTTDIPYDPLINPNAGVPFTFETWLRPTSDRISPGAAPVNNRYVSSGNRTGWVIFQRAPDNSYAGYTPDYEGTGWTFRMYSGAGSSGQDATTGGGWQPGVWQHFVATWEPYQENGDVIGNGNDQWQGVLTVYIDGVPVVSNPNALYSANLQNTEDGTAPADFAVGSYNMASGLGNNPYEGDEAEVAFYPNIVLTTNQIMAHYLAGSTTNYGTNYEALVYSAGLFSTVNGNNQSQEVVDLPSLYLRLNDPAYFAATNSGTLGATADGNLVSTLNAAAGPQTPVDLGFNVFNTALPLDGMTQFASFNNPSGLDIAGQITLEAWVQPAAAQNDTADIIVHGPATISTYQSVAYDGYGPFVNAITNTSEVFLRIDNGGANYSVGSAYYDDSTGVTNLYEATAAIPAGDLGGTAWVHLAGTYDGAKWNLYRNGLLLASQASSTGALVVTNGNWAVGATGNGWGENFAGNIDEVAVYSKALTASQVAAHYVAGKSGTSAITIAPAAGGKVTITWPVGTTLLQASKVNGSWTAVPGSPVSPLTIKPTATTFYRWSL